MRAFLVIVLLIHGLIHLMGFSKAFGLGVVTQISQPITKMAGTFWFVTTILFIAAAIIFILRMEWWWLVAFVAILISQYLIINSWQEARFGTMANVLIFISVIIGFATWSFYRQYKKEVNDELKQNFPAGNILYESEIQNLPKPIRQYLHYVGAVGKPKVVNFKVEFAGDLRQRDDLNWMPFTSQQYNFIPNPSRLFFLKATMKKLPVSGFHCFKDGEASMDIRLLSLFTVQHQAGKEMDIAETVTFFNDMCVLAPSTLVDERIKWIGEEKNIVKAAFTNEGVTITADLLFNDKGELINFISNDRYATLESGSMEKVQWSTPLGQYKEFNGYKLPTYAETIYAFPEGDFCYGKFTLKDVAYNVNTTE